MACRCRDFKARAGNTRSPAAETLHALRTQKENLHQPGRGSAERGADKRID
jgi:hypothetical protein